MNDDHETDDPTDDVAHAAGPEVGTSYKRRLASAGVANGNSESKVAAKKERTGVAAAAPTTAPKSTTPPDASEAPWSNSEADLIFEEMLGGEHPRSLAKYGKTAYDIHAHVIRTDGKRSTLDTIACQDIMGGSGISPGEALRARVTETHLTVAQGPASYEIMFSWRPGTKMYGRGTINLPSPAEIIALRRARAQGAGGYPQQQPTPQASYQPPAGYVPASYQAPPPMQQQSPQQPAVAGYGAPPVQPPYPPSHDPEVSQLRTEVAGLAGSVREMMDYIRGERRHPPAPPPVHPTSPGMGDPQHQPWPRRTQPQSESEMEELREELADLRGDIAGLYRRPVAGPGFGSPQAQPTAQPQQPAAPPPVPKGPNGEIWVDRVGWCVPKDHAQPAAVAPAAAPAPAPAVQPASSQTSAQPAAHAAGVGAAPSDPILTLIDGARSYARNGKALREALQEVSETFSVGFGDTGEEPAQTEPTPEPPSLPFETVKVEGATLFGHDVIYTPNKKTGKLDLEGFAMSNPGVLEEGAKLIGVAVEAVSTFAKRAAASTAGSKAAAAAGQLPAAGVGSTPAQVVSSIPEGAQDANAGAVNGVKPGSFPGV